MAVAVAVCMVMMVGPSLVQAEEFSVPATFVRYMDTPGISDNILRPTAARYDRFHDELMVADSGNNRIVVFAPSGTFRFSFDLTGIITAPMDIAADPDGFIYVLGSSLEGRGLHRFDFDGLSLGPIPMPAEIEGIRVELRSVACADDGRLFVLDHHGRRIIVIDPEQGVVGWFSTQAAPVEEDELFALGRISIAGDEILVPVSNQGTILRLSLDGELLGSIGYFGGKPATLNFPVAAEVTRDGTILVLDQGRFCVVAYSQDGQALGEFGGKGFNPGWFINPSLLAVPSATQVVIGQIFESKIQVCALPDFARGRSQSGTDGDVWDLEAKNLEVPAGPLFQKRSSLRPPRVNFPNQRESSGSHHTDSHLEVSE